MEDCLSAATALTTLTLNFIEQRLHASSLSHLTALRHLDLTRCNVSGLVELAALTCLRSLCVDGCSVPERAVLWRDIGSHLQINGAW